jgi:hypothetical protein
MFNKIGWPNLDEDLCIKIFFMVLNNNFLTPNTYCYIRPVDALWCCDTRAIVGYNWCKIIYDNMREAGRKWKVDRHLRMDRPNVLGCSLFLMVRTHYKCNLFSYTFLQLTTLLISIYPNVRFCTLTTLGSRGALDAPVTPRCAYYTLEIIRNFIHVDQRQLGSGHTRYGKCEVNEHIVLPISCYRNYTYQEAATFLLFSMT